MWGRAAQALPRSCCWADAAWLTQLHPPCILACVGCPHAGAWLGARGLQHIVKLRLAVFQRRTPFISGSRAIGVRDRALMSEPAQALALRARHAQRRRRRHLQGSSGAPRPA